MALLIDENGRVHPALIQLARKTCLVFSENISPEAVNTALQANWIHCGKFRYEIEGKPPGPEELALLTKLGCIEAVESVERWYDGALLMGTTLTRVRTRLQFLVSQYSDFGAYFKTLYLLGSNRPLNPQKESADDLQVPKLGLPLRKPWRADIVPLPTTEIQMMRYVVEQSAVPDEWDVVTIHTPDVALPGSGSRYANTGDTFKRWQEFTTFEAGRFLVASNQPFVAYQTACAKRLLPKEMEFYGIGAAADPSFQLVEYLDTLAKQFYEEFALRELRTKK